jgi:hypothetical protein
LLLLFVNNNSTFLSLTNILLFLVLHIVSGSINLWHNTLSTSPLYHCRLEGPVKTIAMAINNEPTAIAACDHEMRIDVADVNGQWKCQEKKTFETQVRS